MKNSRPRKGLVTCLILSSLMLGLAPGTFSKSGTITTFSAPNAGTSAFQGTFVNAINQDGEVAGSYQDMNKASHGFVRDKHDTITTFDALGAGTRLLQGTIRECPQPGRRGRGFIFGG